MPVILSFVGTYENGSEVNTCPSQDSMAEEMDEDPAYQVVQEDEEDEEEEVDGGEEEEEVDGDEEENVFDWVVDEELLDHELSSGNDSFEMDTPAERSGHIAVVDGSNMYVWGGYKVCGTFILRRGWGVFFESEMLQVYCEEILSICVLMNCTWNPHISHVSDF